MAHANPFEIWDKSGAQGASPRVRDWKLAEGKHPGSKSSLIMDPDRRSYVWAHRLTVLGRAAHEGWRKTSDHSHGMGFWPVTIEEALARSSSVRSDQMAVAVFLASATPCLSARLNQL